MYEFWYDYVKPKYGENAKFIAQFNEVFKVLLAINVLNLWLHKRAY